MEGWYESLTQAITDISTAVLASLISKAPDKMNRMIY